MGAPVGTGPASGIPLESLGDQEPGMNGVAPGMNTLGCPGRLPGLLPCGSDRLEFMNPLRRLLLSAPLMLGTLLGCLDVSPRRAPREPEVLTGRVARVGDGDTFDLEVAGRPRLRVRLQGIDAPELSQDHGREAKAALEALVLGREVQVRASRRDRHGRQTGVVLLEGRDLNQLLVAEGHAWRDPRFASGLPPETARRYARAQAEARAQGRGLWQAPRPEAPWAWRERSPSLPPGVRPRVESAGGSGLGVRGARGPSLPAGASAPPP